MMVGTTPTLTFTLANEAIDLEAADYVWVTLTQGAVSQRYTGEDLFLEDNTAEITLTQAQSTQFRAGNAPIRAQINWAYEDGSRGASEIAEIFVEENLEPGLIPEPEPENTTPGEGADDDGTETTTDETTQTAGTEGET